MKAVNLLPSEQRATPKSVAAAAKPEQAGTTPFGAYVVLGVLGLAVAAVALLALAGNSIKDRKAELARVTAEAQATQQQAASLQTYADFVGLATQRVSTVKGLAGSRFEWERTMADLSRALPGNVHLRTLVGGTSSSAGAGTAAVSSPTIELTGCTVSQTAVAQLMSRLRNVRGVTRVALSNSAKTEDQTSAGTNDTGQLCPKGAPPEFDVTMYFERAAKPAGAAVNAAGATTTTTTTSASVPATDASGTAAVTATPGASATTPTSTTASAK